MTDPIRVLMSNGTYARSWSHDDGPELETVLVPVEFPDGSVGYESIIRAVAPPPVPAPPPPVTPQPAPADTAETPDNVG